MVGPAIPQLFPIRVVSDPCQDISHSIDCRDVKILFIVGRLKQLVIANLLNSKSDSPFGCLNWLAIQFRELIPDDKVGENRRIGVWDSHESTNFLTQLVKKGEIGMVSPIIGPKRLEMDSWWQSHGLPNGLNHAIR
jgi:hypothetical protein